MASTTDRSLEPAHNAFEGTIDFVDVSERSIAADDINSELPLFRLPNELLLKILLGVQDTASDRGFDLERPLWRFTTIETSMIMPTVLTCRRLHALACSFPLLWNTIDINGLTTKRHVETHVSRSQGAPLSVFVRFVYTISIDFAVMWPRIAPRIGALHVYNYHESLNQPYDVFFNVPYPQLVSFSFDRGFASRLTGSPNFPLLGEVGQGCHPSPLRHLSVQEAADLVPSRPFASLTHLDICKSNHTGAAAIVRLLAHCPNLQSLSIRRVRHHSDSVQAPPLFLPHLCRVTLDTLPLGVLTLLLDALPKRNQPYSLQIVDHSLASPVGGEALAPHLPLLTETTTFYTGTRARRSTSGSRYVYGIAAFGAEDLLYAGKLINKEDYRNMSDRSNVAKALMRSFSTQPLSTVRDAWVVNIPPYDWSQTLLGTTRAALASFPELETVNIVVDHHQHEEVTGPDLAALPTLADPPPRPPKLKTVRLIHAYDYVTARQAYVEKRQYAQLCHPHPPARLSLARLLEQLGSGQYDYLERVVVQAAPYFTVDDAELRQLCGLRPGLGVVFEYTDVLPKMPLPEFALEPEAVPGSRAWDGYLY